MSERRTYTYPEIVSMLFSGAHDDLTAAEFRERFPLRAGGDDPRGFEADSVAGPDGSVEYVGLENAVLLDAQEMSLVGAMRNGVRDDQAAVAIKLSGRLNKRDDRVSVLVLTNADGLAALVVEALDLADRVGDDYRDHVFRRVVELNKSRVRTGLAESGLAALLAP